MAVDLLRKYQAIDQKDMKAERSRIQNLLQAGAYPERFAFPLTMQFELTTKCNVYCKHCYNDSGNNQNQDAMTPEKWIAFSRYLVAHGGLFECIISGGEPLLLGDSLFEIMDILHNDGSMFLLITNGYLLSKERVQRLAKYRYRWLQVSIDGSDPAYHDDFRQRAGSWERAVKGAMYVANAGIPLTIAHSITPDNLEKMDDMCDLAYSLGAASIILGEVNLSGRTAQNKDLLLNDDQRRHLLQKYEENAAKYAGKMIVQRSATPRQSILRYLETPNSGLIVRPNGDLRLDCMVPFVVGNVLKEDFLTVWQNKGVSCWKHPMVQEFIAHYYTENDNDMLLNYVDQDIYL